MTSKYPSELDSNIELPYISDNITEIGGDAINGLRDAVFNIEETLGLDPQGTKSNLDERVSVSLNEDGTLKASALSTIGLITLPINNSMISSTAAIEESKLSLNYSTPTLKLWIDENRTNITNNSSRLDTSILHLSNHILHPSAWGGHYTSDIDGYAGTIYDGYNLQGIVYNLNSRIDNHVNDTTNAHNASAVYFDDTYTVITASNVQRAIENIDNYIEGSVTIHQDNQHSNGILKRQNVSYNNSNHSYPLISSSLLYNISVGATSIQFISKPTGFDDIKRGDRVDITIGSSIYTYYVNSINSGSAIINFYDSIPVSGSSATAIVYRSKIETIAPSSLNFSIRQDNVSTSGGSVIQLIHPGAPYILSNGIDVRGLTSSVYNIKLRWDVDETSDIDVYTLMQSFNTSPSTWTINVLAKVLNEEFRNDTLGYHYPLIAFTYKGELGIAFDEPDGYLQIVAPSSNSAWSTLGFSENDIMYSVDRKFYIDGYEFTGINEIIDSSASIKISDVNAIDDIATDIKSAGVKASGLVRVSNSTNDDGTYLFTQVNDSTSINIDEHSFTPDTSIDIGIYADTFSVTTAPSKRTLYELFIDGSDGEKAEFRGTERVEYSNSSASPVDITSFFDIIDISRNFSYGTRRITYTISGTTITMALGTRGSGVTLTQSGPAVTLPAASSDIPGYRFRLIDYDGVNYLDLEVVSNYSTLSTGCAIDVDILDRPNEGHYLQIGKVLHNKTNFKHLDDRRIFGTVGRDDVRNDFTRDYTSYPRSVLRGNGITYGFLLENTVSTVTINGGECLVDGILYTIDKKTFNVPEDGVSSTYNIFVDNDGILQFLKDNQYIDNIISTPSVSEIIASDDKTILWQVVVNASNSVTSSKDYRRYVNNLDNKIELIVEENDITHGSFASLDAAINYLGSSNYASSRIIKIHGEIEYDISNGSIDLLDNIIIEGDANYLGSSTYSSTLSITGTGTSFIKCGIGNVFRNINFNIEENSSLNVFIGSSTGNVDSIIFENCLFNTDDTVSVGTIIGTDSGYFKNFKIIDCKFNVGDTLSCINIIGASGILSNGIIENCYFSNINSSLTYINIIGSLTSSPDGVSDISVENCNINFDDTATNNNFLYSTGNIDDCFISNCVINFTSLTGENNFIDANIIQNTQFVSNKATFTTVTSGLNRAFTVTTSISNCHIEDNIFTCIDETVDSIALISPTIQDSIIQNNKFSYFYTCFDFGSVSCLNLNINNNIISSIGYIGLDLENATDVIISNNNISSDSIVQSDSCLIQIDTGENIIIDSNIITTSSTNTPEGYALRFKTESNGINISNNCIVNTIYAEMGYLKAILFDLGASYNDHRSIVIDNNIVLNFSGAPPVVYSFEGISLSSCSGAIVSDNLVYNTTLPLNIYECHGVNVCGNFLQTGASFTYQSTIYYMDAEYQCVKVSGTSTFTEIPISLSGNTFKYFSLDADSSIVDISNLTCLVEGNVFYNLISSATAYAILKNTADYCTISNNYICGGTLASTTESPIYSTGDNCYVKTNSIYKCNVSALSSGAVDVSGDGSIDYMNKGATYSTIIPISRAVWDASLGWGIYPLITILGLLVYNTGASSAEGFVVEFSSADIPTGALLKTIKVYLKTADGAGDCSVYLKSSPWNSAGIPSTIVGPETTTTTANETVTLTMPADTYIEDNLAYLTYFETKATFGAVYIYSIYLTYEL